MCQLLIGVHPLKTRLAIHCGTIEAVGVGDLRICDRLVVVVNKNVRTKVAREQEPLEVFFDILGIGANVVEGVLEVQVGVELSPLLT